MTEHVLQDRRVTEQVAVLAVRHNGDDIELCLIRKKNSGTTGIPKGFIDPGDTPEEAALKEAWEEAGIMGQLVGTAIGAYVYEKWGSTFTVAVYVMKVMEEHLSWPEMRYRERSWRSITEAASLLTHHPVRPVRPLLDRLGARLGPVSA